MTRRITLALLALAAAAALPGAAGAQNACALVYQSGSWSSFGTEGQRLINAGGPLLVRCQLGEELRADSAVLYEQLNEVHLFGRVDYQDPGRSLTSDYATYNGTTGRLYATGNVVFTDKGRGSTLRGPVLEYFKAGPGRPDAQAIATGRPHLTIAPRGDNPRRREPMEVDGDRITTVGEKFVTAEGNVVIEGSDMDAWAEEAHWDATTERMELRRSARARGERYELTADFIETHLPGGALQRVLARGNARLLEERMRITGPQLQLFFQDDLVQRMVSGQVPGAAEKGRSVALARGFRMEADSLEAISPGQKLRQLIAVGTAAGESWDTLRVPGPRPGETDAAREQAGRDSVLALPLGERDLLFADTIIGFFRERPDTGAVAAAAVRDTTRRDTANDAELERMLAMKDARSLYRMRPDEDRPDQKPGINYVIADTIDLTFAAGEVDVARVRGLKRGVYLDPEDPAARARRDSIAAARGDTASVRPGAPPAGAQPGRPTSTPPAGRTPSTRAALPADPRRPGGPP
ncbi:MAG TPA: OstA-like protein [Longimicrobium sp.]|nr:OstA-like protein [Longimicrobium sp.]